MYVMSCGDGKLCRPKNSVFLCLAILEKIREKKRREENVLFKISAVLRVPPPSQMIHAGWCSNGTHTHAGVTM